MFIIKFEKIDESIKPVVQFDNNFDSENDYYISLLDNMTEAMYDLKNYRFVIEWIKNDPGDLQLHFEFCILLEEMPHFSSFLLHIEKEGRIHFVEQGFYIDIYFFNRQDHIDIKVIDHDKEKVITETTIPFNDLLHQFITLMNNFLVYATEIYPEFTEHYYYQDWINEGSLKEFIEKYCSIDKNGR